MTVPTSTDHPRQGELGDGPAFVLTYGVPTIPAALLCQMGFASRPGAVWVTCQLTASFTNTEAMHDWLRENDAFLDDPDFWQSVAHHLMWTHAAAPSGAEYPQPWSHRTHEVAVKWNNSTPKQDSLTRITAGISRTATVCESDLSPLGSAQLPFDPHGAALDGRVCAGGKSKFSISVMVDDG